MTPTAQGRHCAVCTTEVVDFTRMSEAEVLAFLAARAGQRVCGLAFSSQLAPPAPASRWRRWLVAGLALLGWQPVASSCAPKPPQAPPTQASATPAPNATAPDAQQVVIRGQVLDGANNAPVAGVRVLINDTEFGTTTDDKGNFELTMARSWAPIAGGKVALKFSATPLISKSKP